MVAQIGDGHINLPEGDDVGNGVVDFDPLCSQKSACLTSLAREHYVVDSSHYR